MLSSGDELHPNWRALATVHLPLKRFIKEGEVEKSVKSDNARCHAINGVEGDEAKEFYEQLLAEKNATAVMRPTIESVRIRIEDTKPFKKADTKLPFERSKFFRHAQNNDIIGLRSFQLQAGELDSCDEFGWTGLMVAACAGASDAVKVLLQLGADKTIKDRSGKTAFDMARQNGHESVVKILESNLTLKTNEKVKNKPIETRKSFYCQICQRNFTESSETSHQTSTVHQFNMKSSKPSNKLERFNIPHRNRGLKLMVKQGWDKESGLGPTQNGRLYPVKTVIRNKRTGLGTEQPPARVTHFEPYDLRATQRDSSIYEYYKKKQPSRNDIRREKVRDWKRNRRLRNELS